jgi:hypothetical protein
MVGQICTKVHSIGAEPDPQNVRFPFGHHSGCLNAVRSNFECFFRALQKTASRRGKGNAFGSADEQIESEFHFQISNLGAQRLLGDVQSRSRTRTGWKPMLLL